jgi:hypothetical protein
MVRPAELRFNVRQRAEGIVKEYLMMHKKQGRQRSMSVRLREHDSPVGEFSERSLLEVEDVPMVFNRAALSKMVLVDYKTERLSVPGRRSSVHHAIEGISQIQHLSNETGDDFLVDEDCLSLESVNPEADHESSNFDYRKRTPLERLFAVDKHVRHGKLAKHLHTTRHIPQKNDDGSSEESKARIGGSRALVIEGAALKHMFGDAVSFCVKYFLAWVFQSFSLSG